MLRSTDHATVLAPVSTNSDPHDVLDVAPTQASLKTQLVAAHNNVWPDVCSKYTFGLGDGVTQLDPLVFSGAVKGGGGPCPWACGTYNLKTITGLASATFHGENATLAAKNCGAAAVVFVVPATFATAVGTVDISATLLNATQGLNDVVLTLKDVNATLSITIPFVPDVTWHLFGPNYILDFSGTKVEVVLDISQLSTASNLPGFMTPALNEVLSAGAATALQRIADSHVSEILTRELQVALSSGGGSALDLVLFQFHRHGLQIL